MSVNGIMSSTSAGVRITHNSTDRGTNGLRWVGSDNLGNIRKVWITDLKYLASRKNSETVVNSDIPLGTGGNVITVCLNREADMAYALSGDAGEVPTLYAINLSSGVTVSKGTMGSLEKYSPLKALINRQGNEIMWLGSDNKLRTVALDGTGLQAVSVRGRQRFNTFCLSKDNVAYCVGSYTGFSTSSQNLWVNRITSVMGVLTLETYDNQGLSDYSLSYPLSAAHYDGNSYFLLSADGKAKVVKIPDVTWDDSATYILVDLTTYGIVDLTGVKFNLGYDPKTKAYHMYLGVNDNASQQMLWRMDLTSPTLEMTPLRVISLTKSGDSTVFEGEFSADVGKDIQRVVVSGPNDDFFGGQVKETTGGI